MKRQLTIPPEVTKALTEAKVKIHKRLYDKETLKLIKANDKPEDFPEKGGRRIVLED